MFLATGTSGAIGATGGVPEYQTSQEGGTTETVHESVQSGAGPYAGPSMNYTRPLSDYYVPQAMIAPIHTVPPPAVVQAPNTYTNTGPTLSVTATAPKSTDCGCGDGSCNKIPWYVLVGLVLSVVLLLKD